MKPSHLCANGCIADAMTRRVAAVLHDLELARLDLNAMFRQSLFTDRRHSRLTPTLERRQCQ